MSELCVGLGELLGPFHVCELIILVHTEHFDRKVVAGICESWNDPTQHGDTLIAECLLAVVREMQRVADADFRATAAESNEERVQNVVRLDGPFQIQIPQLQANDASQMRTEFEIQLGLCIPITATSAFPQQLE